jgi:hypothetical protein
MWESIVNFCKTHIPILIISIIAPIIVAIVQPKILEYFGFSKSKKDIPVIVNPVNPKDETNFTNEKRTPLGNPSN